MLFSTLGFGQYDPCTHFYAGFGTTFGSFVGANFGSTFALRFRNPYSDYYGYNNNYNNHYNNYYNNYDSPFSMSPLELDLVLGQEINRYVSIELQANFIAHFNGSPARNYTSGTSGTRDYLDYYDNSYLTAIPLMASLKIFPAGKDRAPFYLSFSAGYQYTHESMDRVREYYDNGNNYNYSNYSYPLYNLYDNKWIPGMGLSMGGDVRVSDIGYTNIELKVTNFWTEMNTQSPLAMNTSPNITYIGLSAKFYFTLGR